MTPAATVDEFIRRVVSLDLDGAVELVAGDLEYDNVPIGKVHGPQAMRDFLAAMVNGVDEIQFVTHRQVAEGRLVLNERTDRFRIGERWLDLPVAGVFQVDEDGRIVLWRDYFDNATFVDQLNDILAG